MPELPDPHHSTMHHIDLAIEAAQDDGWRPHLGASVIGNECDRQIQYTFRWARCVQHTARMLRLFDRGHMEELRIHEWLRKAQILVWAHDSDGQQFSFRSGHFGGHADGIVARIPEAMATLHLLECKTHNEKSFKQLTKHRSIKESHPRHYDQMVCYMYHLELTRGLYVAVNKNTDDLYLERVKADNKRARYLTERATGLALSSQWEPRISEDPTWWQCKVCDYLNVCHFKQPLAKNCRTCALSETTPAGSWMCTVNREVLTLDKQKRGCASYEPLA